MVGLAASLNLAAQRFALMWAQEHLPAEEYEAIKKSREVLMKRTAAFVVLCCIPVIVAFMFVAFSAPFSTKMEEAATPSGASGYVMARVDYDGNFYWTHDSKKYEYALEDYGLEPGDYEFKDEVKVYIDDNQEIVKVTDVGNHGKVRTMEVAVGAIGSILVPVLLIVLIYMPIAYRTFGRRWIEFYRDFDKM